MGIENLGENFKNMQEEMVTWQTGYQNAEGEYQRMNEELFQEIPLSAPAEVRPEIAVTPPVVSVPPCTYLPVHSSCTSKCATIIRTVSWMLQYRPNGLSCLHSGNHILVHHHRLIGVLRDLMCQHQCPRLSSQDSTIFQFHWIKN